MTTVDDLVAAWQQWDRQPGSELTARAKEQATAALGLNALLLHDRVAALRQEGVGLEAAVRRAAAEQEGGG